MQRGYGLDPQNTSESSNTSSSSDRNAFHDAPTEHLPQPPTLPPPPIMLHNAGSIQEPSKLLRILVKSLSQNQTKGTQWLPGAQLMPFAGTRRENVEYWLLSVDLYCEAQSIRNNHHKVMLAASALRDEALDEAMDR
ncbi:hypothetical protein IWQ60_012293, partial [Tieghemiomyces parasiticus]